MEWLTSALGALGTTLDVLSKTPAAAFLSGVGILLILLSLFLASEAVKREPNQMPFWMRAGLFGSFIGGVLFSFAGPAVALFWNVKPPPAPLSSEQMFERLEKNHPVEWLLRLIPYDEQSDQRLSITKLERLSPPKQQFSFVGAFEDLFGYPVIEVVQRMGLTYGPGQRVSAIAFPLKTKLYPANARGLLQVISNVEKRTDISIQKPFFAGRRILTDEQWADLDVTSIISYRFDNYAKFFRQYCELAHQFRCNREYSAHEYIGGIGADWHPLGFSQHNPETDPCRQPDRDYCAISSLRSARTNKFGARVFFIQNMDIDRISDRTLVDFGKPAEQILPDFRSKTRDQVN